MRTNLIKKIGSVVIFTCFMALAGASGCEDGKHRHYQRKTSDIVEPEVEYYINTDSVETETPVEEVREENFTSDIEEDDREEEEVYQSESEEEPMKEEYQSELEND